MEVPAQHTFIANGNTRIFPISSYIKSHEYIKIFLNEVAFLDTTAFDIRNNNIIFLEAPILNTEIVVWVAEGIEAINNLGLITNVDIVAENIASINEVGNNLPLIEPLSADIGVVVANKANITTVATNIPAINEANSNIPLIQDVGNNIEAITTVGTDPVKSAILSASGDADSASASANEASSSANEASAYASYLLDVVDEFDKRYLGSKPSDPSFDNTGDVLVAGTLYFNTTNNVMKVYNGTGWVVAYVASNEGLLAVNNLGDILSIPNARTNLSVYSKLETTAGTLTLTNKTIADYSNHIEADIVHQRVKAVETISKGQAVSFSGYNAGENATEVVLTNNGTSVSIGIASEDIAIGSFGTIIAVGVLEGLDTSAYVEGTILYPDGSGGLTAIPPTTGFAQPLVFVIRSSATVGAIRVNAQYPKQDANDVRYDTTQSVFDKIEGLDTTVYDDTVIWADVNSNTNRIVDIEAGATATDLTSIENDIATIKATNIGKLDSTPVVLLGSISDWYNVPIGGMIRISGSSASLPVAMYYDFIKISQEFNKYNGIVVRNDKVYALAGSSTALPTWTKLATEATATRSATASVSGSIWLKVVGTDLTISNTGPV